MRILMTGNTGFVGSNVLPIMKKNGELEIYTPTRTELNLKDEIRVVEYLKTGKFDVILHFANPTPAKNIIDSENKMLEDSMRIFLNLYNHRDLFGKMLYTGSGAEYDKTLDIDLVREEDCYRSVPKDQYGFAKMMMNHLAENSDNVFNFRLFGCYGPGDHESKFITHCIRSVLLDRDISIRKDCEFDYIHVFDFARYIKWGIEKDLRYHSYNVSSGDPVLLSDIANKVLVLMGSDRKIRFLSGDYNRNYTACNERIMKESELDLEYTLERGIRLQIEWEKNNWGDDTKFDGE